MNRFLSTAIDGMLPVVVVIVVVVVVIDGFGRLLLQLVQLQLARQELFYDRSLPSTFAKLLIIDR
jgi:hypothetical protein